MIRKMFFIFFILLISKSAVFSADLWPYVLKRGNLHVHTKFSEKARHLGSLGKIEGIISPVVWHDHLLTNTIAETCKIAEEIGLDVIGISDHDCALTKNNWQEIIAQSNKNQKLIVLSGFEWTNGDFEHINIFGSSNFISARALFVGYGIIGVNGKVGLASSLDSIYRFIIKEGKSNPYLVGQYNHPGYTTNYFKNFDIPNELNVVKDYMTLFEIRSGPSIKHTSIDEEEKIFEHCLRRNIFVCPTIGIDNFGTLSKENARNYSTGIWVDPSSGSPKEQVLSALLQRKTFASEDSNYVLKFWAKNDQGETFYLGDKITIDRGKAINFYINAVDPDEPRGRVILTEVRKYDILKEELISKLNTFTVKKYPDTNSLYYYLKILQNDGNIILSAPIGVDVEIPEPMPQQKYNSGDIDKFKAFHEAMFGFSFRIITCTGYKDGLWGPEPFGEKNTFDLRKEEVFFITEYANLEEKYKLPCTITILTFDPDGLLIDKAVFKIDVNDVEISSVKKMHKVKITKTGIYVKEGYVNGDLRDRKTFKIIK